MKDLARLQERLKELERSLQACMRCGMCQSVCPVFERTGLESDVTRGKLALLDGLARDLMHDHSGAAERLQRCLLCGSCEANCPSGVRAKDIFLNAREILTTFQGLSPVKRILLRSLLAHPRLFDWLMSVAARLQPLVLKKGDQTLGSSCGGIITGLLPQGPLGKGVHVRGLAKTPFHATCPEAHIPAHSGQPTAAFFTGCVIDKLFPGVAQASLAVLEHYGVGVFMPANQGCCGIPALASGDRDTARSLLRHNLERFARAEFDVVLTGCATCAATLRELWPSTNWELEPGEQAALDAFSSKAMDITAFLDRHLDLDPVMEKAEGHKPLATYHDPCHLRKSLEVFKEPRALLRQAGYQLKEMANPDACCGMGGSFHLSHYELSAAIGDAKARDILATGAEVAVTACPACMLQLTESLGRAGASLPIRHPVELLAESLGLVDQKS